LLGRALGDDLAALDATLRTEAEDSAGQGWRTAPDALSTPDTFG
jgi:hypothetical protein